MIIEQKGSDLLLSGVECLSLPLTLDCGEAFRWKMEEDGSWSGVAFEKYLNIKEENGVFILKNTSPEDFEGVWRRYFDLDRDYAAICARLKQDALLSSTIDEYYGIRILNQEPWEALVSFIISQQNNIKRIKGIISRLCNTYGRDIGGGRHAFPTSAALSALTVSQLEEMGLGYRAKYVKKLADDVEAGATDLEAIRRMPLEDAKKALLGVYGVGEKVANCALLFGFGFIRCFPVDVWMKRVLEFYPNGLPECFEGCEGVAQQYLFHWARNNIQG